MNSRRRLTGVGVGALTIAACASFGPATPSDVSSVPEGGPGPSSDGSVPTSLDTGLDAVADTDGPTPFCTASHTFCDDFDDGSVGARWTTIVNGGGGMRLDDASFVSAPRFLTAEMEDDAAAPELLLQRKVIGTFGSASLEADVMIKAAPATPDPTVTSLDLVFSKGDANWHLRLQHSRDALTVVEIHYGYPDGGYDYVFHKVAQAMPLGIWRHIKMEVKTGSPTRASVSVDGELLFDEDLRETWLAGPLEITAGAFATYGNGAGWKINVDNVALAGR